MAAWIQDAIHHLQQSRISSSSSLSKVCQEQVKILRVALGRVHTFLEEIQDVALDAAGKEQNLVAVGEDVKRILHLGLRLIESYEEDNWVITALLSEEGREDFKHLHAELYDSLELASGFMFEAATSERDKSRIREAYSTCLMRKTSVSILELAAVNDRKQMMRMVLSSDDAEEDSILQLLCAMLVEKSAPLLDHIQLKFKQHLKQGGYGTVYEACWLDQLDVAVKVFSSGDSSFRRELAALASCKHPKILRIVGYAYDSEKQQHSLVMEKMDMDLADLIMKIAKFTALQSIDILLEIAKGMAWLHSKDVIHRDLKPQNILIVSKDGIMDLKIADFGLSRINFVTSRVSLATPKLGTRIFMAPEVWNSQHYSKKSDVFSFAMICYQLLTGRMPFVREVVESSDYMLRVCNGMRPLDEFPESCPVELAELTRHCWSGDAKERPSFSEICETLKLLKAKILTNVQDWTEVRKNLIASASSGSTGHVNQNHNRTRVDTDSLHRNSRASPAGSSSTRTSSASSQRQSSTYPPSSSSSTRTRPSDAPSKLSSNKEDLLKIVQRGKMTEAFQTALSLNDPKTLWWLAKKVDCSLMHTFDDRMVLSIAEQLNEVLGVDPVRIADWLAKAIELLTSNRIKYNSTRLYRLLERIAQSLHGLIAITPKDSELAEFLQTNLTGANEWLQRVQVQIQLYGAK